MSENKQKFFPVLAGLRTVMASLVFVYHFYAPENFTFTFAQIIVLLKYRMTIFFVLSGFVIMYSLLPHKHLTFKQYLNFLIGKLVRLFPLYLLILIVPYFQVGLPPFHIFITNVTLLKGFFKQLFLTGIGPSWSITVEITFYIFAPFILKKLNTTKGFLSTYLIILLLGIFLTAVGMYLNQIGNNPYGFFADFPFTLNKTFFGRATDFFTGIFIAWYISKNHSSQLQAPPKIKKTYLGIALILLVCFLAYYFESISGVINEYLSLFNLNFLLPIIVGIFLYGIIKENSLVSKFLSLKLLVWLGNGSYAFYLMHTSWVQYKLEQITLIPDKGFLLLWLTAMLTYHLFEKPLTTFLRNNLRV